MKKNWFCSESIFSAIDTYQNIGSLNFDFIARYIFRHLAEYKDFCFAHSCAGLHVKEGTVAWAGHDIVR
jgi:hypothetical protein